MLTVVMRRATDRKSTRLNASHTEIYTLSLHDALPIWKYPRHTPTIDVTRSGRILLVSEMLVNADGSHATGNRSEEHTSERQSHRDLHSFPTRRSSDLEVSAAYAHD